MPIGAEAVAYAAANAQISGLRARLLSGEAWDRLVEAEGLADALMVLRESDYAEWFPVGAAQPTDLEGIERGLMGLTAENCWKSRAFLRGSRRALLQVWWGHFELENLKAVFRGVDQGLSPSQIRSFQIPLGAHSGLPWEALLHERSIPSLVERLNRTHYVNPLRNALHLYTRYGSLFPLEVALDVRYYRDIAAGISRLGAGDRASATKLLGTYLDILNILWAYRYRVYYGLSAEEIVNFTMWHTVRTDVPLIQAIAMGAEPVEIVGRIWGEGRIDLSELAQSDSDADKVPLLEIALLRYWRGLSVSALSGYRFGLGAILAYLILQEIEVQDLVTVLEAKGLAWSQDHIQTRLIRTGVA